MSRNNQTEDIRKQLTDSEIFRELGVGEVGYIKAVETEKFIEEHPELTEDLKEFDDILYVGREANGDLILVSECPDRVRDRLIEDELYIETLH
jgi:hypothetical protein